MIARGDQRADDRRGRGRRGSFVSSASVPAVSNPYITYALKMPPMRRLRSSPS